MSTRTEATVEDLYRVPENGKAELVNGELVLMSPTGGLPGIAGLAIAASLLSHARLTKTGHAIPDNVGFLVDLPNRKSFSPDAAYHVGPVTKKFITGAPIFAVEVRSEVDYEPAALREMAEKRADYFAAGTLVVWDVDVLDEGVIRSYRADQPDAPIVFRRGEIAHAEPAVPGWTMPVKDLWP
jgi:Uma2 family endonuclease